MRATCPGLNPCPHICNMRIDLFQRLPVQVDQRIQPLQTQCQTQQIMAACPHHITGINPRHLECQQAGLGAVAALASVEQRVTQ